MINIPVNTPLLSGNELKYVTDCINTGWISSEGPYIKKFEHEFAKYVGKEFGIAVSNGSAALDIAIKALNFEIGTEIIMPTFTIISPAQSVITNGCIPVLIDSHPDNWNMDVSKIEEKISIKTKAILVVHIYGLPVDMKPILYLCRKYNLKLIEDAAEMHGQTYNGQLCGSFGDISIFSFYPNKHITTGEGGMILTDDIDLKDRFQKLRNLAFEPNGRRFVHEEIGWNYRMTNMQAALGLAQLERIETHIKRKREIGDLYFEAFSNLKNFKLQDHETAYSKNIYWVFGMIANSEELCNETVNYLNSVGIGTRPFFWCMHEQPVFKKMGFFNNEKYPVSERLARCGFYLPSGLGLKNDEIEIVIKNVLKICN